MEELRRVADTRVPFGSYLRAQAKTRTRILILNLFEYIIDSTKPALIALLVMYARPTHRSVHRFVDTKARSKMKTGGVYVCLVGVGTYRAAAGASERVGLPAVVVTLAPPRARRSAR